VSVRREILEVIAFGPIPSRRLGRSLGINNVPPKTCTYSCVYCQAGLTTRMQVKRRPFYDPEEILRAVRSKVDKAGKAGERVDYLTFVADGEPALDVNLDGEIAALKPLGIPIAVITNASLVWREDVRQALLKADWVSLKVDAVAERAWRQIDRPHGTLRLTAVLEGMLAFGRDYAGTLVTETMLVAGLNDGEGDLRQVADFLARLRPERAYLSIPTRPPAESWVQPPGEEAVNQAYRILSERVTPVECLIGYEGDAFAFTGNVEQDLLSITAVHPMRREAVDAFLARAGAGWSTVRHLIERGQLVEMAYDGQKYYRGKINR
jgi:wyosine [tRNA(Phe)-imidazoG37] synthetase (radical SAM superfamily)